VLDDETDSQSPPLTEDDDGDSSGSDSGSDEIQPRQQPPHTTDLAPVPSVTPPVTPVTPAPVAAPLVVVATAAQSTNSQQHTPLLVTTTPTTTTLPPQPRQRQHHKCSASHPATGARPKLVVKPRRHYSHSLPHAVAAANVAAASASPPIGQLIRTVIFNQSAIMTAMTHGASSSLPPRSVSVPSRLSAATLPRRRRSSSS